jgi:plastocyanin
MPLSCRRWAALGVASLLVLGLGACGKSDDKQAEATGTARSVDTPPTSGTVVNVKGFRYTPPTVTVDKGKEVVWTFNDGSVPHDVKGPGFASPSLQAGQAWGFTFTSAGTFKYLCSIHPYMKGTVVVR